MLLFPVKSWGRISLPGVLVAVVDQFASLNKSAMLEFRG
jgi:hypothetical protein